MPWAARLMTPLSRSSSHRPPGDPTSPIRPTSSRRCCDSSGTTRFRRRCPPPRPASGSPSRRRRAVGWAGRLPARGSSRCSRTPSWARSSSTHSACRPTTLVARCCCSPTPCPTSSPECAPPCFRASSPRLAATSAVAPPTWRSTRSDRCRTSRPGRRLEARPRLPGRRSRTARPTTSWRLSTRSCPRSVRTSRCCCAACAIARAGGEQAWRRAGPTVSRRCARWWLPSTVTWWCAPVRPRCHGIRVAAPNWSSTVSSSGMRASCTPGWSRPRGCQRVPRWPRSTSTRSSNWPAPWSVARTWARSPSPRRTSLSWSSRRCSHPMSSQPCGQARETCSSRCASSTCTRDRRWARGASRWPSRFDCGPLTAR